MDEEESVVLLGVVQEKQSVDAKSPYICKAGGRPAWYAQDEPSEAKTLICSKCNRHLFLVAQVYAPVDTDRTLYVFGCNSPECTETPGSWRVLRDQVAPSGSSNAPELPAQASPAQTTSAASTAPTAVGWAIGGDDDSDWSEDESSDADGEDVASRTNALQDLESLLQQRDNAMKSALPPPPAASTPAAPAPVVAKQTPTIDCQGDGNGATAKLNVFPAVSIDVISEPYENYTKEHDYSHENELLQAYIKSEEEEKSADVTDLRRIIAVSNKKQKNGGTTSDAAAGAVSSGSSASASSGESYERTPAQQKHFMRFQKRISRCPLQVLRYDYGGEPLWPTVVHKNKIKVPRCTCGEDRTFEMQLTPTINYFLKVDEYAHTKIQRPSAGAAPAASATGGGMDWSSVVVYSCSKSCSKSNEEFVVVLPSHS